MLPDFIDDILARLTQLRDYSVETLLSVDEGAKAERCRGKAQAFNESINEIRELSSAFLKEAA